MKQYLTFTFYILLFALLTACGSTPNTSPDSGALTFNIKLTRPATAYLTSYLTGNDICIDYGVATVTAVVKDSSGKTVTSGSWSCSAHQGSITGIPSGNNYTVKLEGKDSDSTVTWSGEKTGISISKGETTAAGTIAMTYIGSDTTAPTVESTSPSDSAVNVPVTSLLTATLSEKMAISSVNSITFKLTNGTTPVSGSVTYDSNTKKAIFIPATNLSYSTAYTATITTGVEDMAGNNMQADKTWSFTTETQPTSAPSAPTGVIATAGNGQTTITWDAVTGATSYNIYWSTTAGITKGTGTKISSVTSPYIHTGRNNGTTYYYVVTAENGIGESNTSAEVSAIPVATDTTPPTGSVIINNNATYTNSTIVTLTLSATDSNGVSQMCISNESTCPSSSWETYTTSKSWTLTAGDGTKTVYTWFKDGAGNVSIVTSDSITLATAPAAPAGVTPAAGNGQATISWDALTGAASYNIYWSTTAGVTKSTGTKISGITSASYTHTGLTNGTTYYYVVTAVDGYGESSESSQVSAVPYLPTPVTLAAMLHGPSEIAIDSTSIYWTGGSSDGSGYVMKVGLNGGMVTTLASGLMCPCDIVVDSTSVYWTEYTHGDITRGAIKKVGIAGGTVSTLVSGYYKIVGLAVVDSTSVYWQELYNGLVPGKIYKISINDGTVTTLTSGYFSTGITNDNTSIYWSDGDIRKIDINGGDVTTIAVDPTKSVAYDIAVDSTSVYWLTGDGNLNKADKNGGNVTTIATGQTSGRRIAVDSNSVYWTVYENGGVVYKADKNGGTLTVLISGLFYPLGIALDSTSVYWTEVGQYGTVKKLPK